MKTLVHHPLQPVYNSESHTLILGTMPSPVSRKEGFYYAHAQNRFWRVLSIIFAVPFPEAVEERKKLVLSRGIALWDVLASCDIEKAADSSIQNPEPNDIPGILKKTNITKIYTTGQKAGDLYAKLCFPYTGIKAEVLPSTSPANRRYPLDVLVEKYSVLRRPG
ncbi:DNA-deoxyinosine glycosylase [Brucepastera parasyntrophica]|uniref:DNA-deoxyinosine glycosylase n=1 Tax=Brucepastera parasyntrophica TaxID=2880008 RepID=UPI00210C2718|nr:DNA-deoxyinosine glycosylase [Brucepastera parasyntrophica]ULQ59790.1 DNA-deoxyinosine glycosylase [Brucepastera parasyntrophica]